MNRRGGSRFFGKKPRTGKGKDGQIEQESVHRRNFRVAAYPVLIIFQLIRFLAFQLWLLLTVACQSVHSVSSAIKSTNKDQPLFQEDIELSEENEVFETHTPVFEHIIFPEMPQTPTSLPNPGPGEPALVKQKQHHRKAFEYISKALKLDEENKGIYFIK